jgi:hypothetical protein
MTNLVESGESRHLIKPGKIVNQYTIKKTSDQDQSKNYLECEILSDMSDYVLCKNLSST